MRPLLLLVLLAGLSLSPHASTTSPAQFPPAPPPATVADAPGAPQNLTASVQGTTVALAWTPPLTGGAPSIYVAQASLTPGGAIIASAQVPGTGITVPGVPPNVYFVRVRAQNGDGTSPPSNEVQVVVGNVCPSPPSPPGTLQASVTGDSVALAWSAPAGGCPLTGYVLQAGSAPGLSNIVNTAVGLATSLGATAPPGTYFVRVLAMNGVGPSPPSNEVAVTVAASSVPAAPVAFSATASGRTATFSWTPSPAGGAPTGYLLEATLIAGGPVIATLPVPGTTMTVPNAPTGTFFVSVRGVNASGAGPASAQQSITISDAPNCAPGTPGAPSANVAGTNVNISWNAVNAATSYRLDVGTAAGSSNLLSEQLTATSRQLTGLSNGTYFMRVTALNACGAGAPSSEATFTIGSPPPPTSVTVTGPSPIEAGNSQQYTATAGLASGPQNVTTSSSWSSTNSAVATVSSSGVVTGVSAGAAGIRATFQGMTGTRNVQVIPKATPKADFIWKTSTDSSAVGEGQCVVTSVGQTESKQIQCIFDASASTPESAIENYVWSIPVQPNLTFSGKVLNNPTFSGGVSFGGLTTLPVVLTIVTSSGTFSVTKTVTFVRRTAA